MKQTIFLLTVILSGGAAIRPILAANPEISAADARIEFFEKLSGLEKDVQSGLEGKAAQAAMKNLPSKEDYKQRLDRLAGGRLAYVEGIYRHLHENPELSLHEKETSALMAREMQQLGFDVTAGVGGYGVVSVLKNGPGPTALIRTDMDALPIQEETGLPYASHVPGVMHACGHDIHMSISLGTAYALAQMKDLWHGTLVMIAQPAEEVGAGANAMIQDGLFARFPRADYALALHDSDKTLAGELGVHPGYMYAANDSFNVVFFGRGTHGAYPHQGIDPFDQMAEFKLRLNTLVAREVDVNTPAVISVGRITGGTRRNVIPDSVQMEGIIRTTDERVRAFLRDRVKAVADGVAAAAGAPAPKLEFLEPVSAVYSDPKMSQSLVPVFQDVLGRSVLDRPRGMASEDFGNYGQAGGFPSFMYWVGAQPNLNPPVPPIHSSRFAPVFGPTWTTGVKSMTSAVIYLQANPPSAQP